METQVLKEVREVRKLLSKIVGTSDLAAKKQFSTDALDKAAKEFQDLSIKRGEWIKENEISRIIRTARHNSGKFIIEKFDFKNYFKRRSTLYFYKKDIVALNNELKQRNINLGRYMELLHDQEKFKKYVERIGSNEKKRKKHFRIPEGLMDIDTQPYPPPSVDLVYNHIATLKQEFENDKLSQYIDVYHDSHAMFKFQYYFDHYMDAGLKKQCKKWCEDFNYANHALQEILANSK